MIIMKILGNALEGGVGVGAEFPPFSSLCMMSIQLLLWLGLYISYGGLFAG